jgi:cytochrome c oxidase subunit 2
MHCLVALTSALLLTSACRNETEHDPVARGAEIYQLCAQCHGPAGAGNHAIRAPAIAGQYSWYVARQLRKFQDGIRGAHPDDATGLQMRAMALSLRNEEDIEAVAAYVAQLPPSAPEATLTDGHADVGAALFGTCSTCHGAEGTGNSERSAPSLVRTNDWYLMAQLQKFKTRVRGGSPNDVEAAQMLPWVSTLDGDQAVKDVLAHIQTLR